VKPTSPTRPRKPFAHATPKRAKKRLSRFWSSEGRLGRLQPAPRALARDDPAAAVEEALERVEVGRDEVAGDAGDDVDLREVVASGAAPSRCASQPDAFSRSTSSWPRAATLGFGFFGPAAHFTAFTRKRPVCPFASAPAAK
jgi:hypothetical protein